jgi:hypothetical protein
MAPWLQFLEAWAVQQLLRTPAFHRAVEKIARRVHRARHGIPPDELGGTNIDQPGQSGFLKHFIDEVKTQLGAAEQRQEGMVAASRKNPPSSAKSTASRPVVEKRHQQSPPPPPPMQENADSVWRDAQRNVGQEGPKQGFLGEYMSALREQIKQNPKDR